MLQLVPKSCCGSRKVSCTVSEKFPRHARARALPRGRARANTRRQRQRPPEPSHATPATALTRGASASALSRSRATPSPAPTCGCIGANVSSISSPPDSRSSPLPAAARTSGTHPPRRAAWCAAPSPGRARARAASSALDFAATAAAQAPDVATASEHARRGSASSALDFAATSAVRAPDAALHRSFVSFAGERVAVADVAAVLERGAEPEPSTAGATSGTSSSPPETPDEAHTQQTRELPCRARTSPAR
ncbi:uncharacterized protein LOC133930181 [Phragmites australis]|uniref:uncharacterized protein LOC133930181 n=1 Tax=Phragmites australis TaxID=29695 RepID=UPI002D792025|nr:uncharacterized protein LOC133930181 [Phragmites australis]